MLYYNKSDISKIIAVAKSNSRRECMVYRYRFFNHGFQYQDFVCNRCHNLLMECVNISDIALITVKGADYCCIIHGISKSESINLLENLVLDDRGYI